ncbi:MAG: NAD(P)-dependent malic enzyme [Thermoleophilia bacterium]|jgi:malate dehydrogenase (oxaloacetate-decarboxylating)
MNTPDLALSDLGSYFPDDFTPEERAKAQTFFLKELAAGAHRFYRGKMESMPKAGFYGFNWFNVYYTPGVSVVSTSIRDDNDASFELSNRGNLVAVVSDSTRVLGDGDVTPAGGLGVMEGKAFLMKYLGGVDGVALCVNSYNKEGKHDPDKIIDFVKMVEPSFGAVNLEDISQPNCFKVLETLREECDIPVWHDDAQGTASVILAGITNALRVVGKELNNVNVVLLGAGAANSTTARLLLADGADPERMVAIDVFGGVHKKRDDLRTDEAYASVWKIAQSTNPMCVDTAEEAFKGADIVIAASKPGPDTIKPAWISSMAAKPILFACANPVPEIYPYAAKEAGAYVVATGRGDFPNQVNNSIGFPGILKGTLMVRARKITDKMAIAAAHAVADYVQETGISPERIMPSMQETEVFAREAADVAMQAIADGVARVQLTWDEVYNTTLADIQEARRTIALLQESGHIATPDLKMLEDARDRAIAMVRK